MYKGIAGRMSGSIARFGLISGAIWGILSAFIHSLFHFKNTSRLVCVCRPSNFNR